MGECSDCSVGPDPSQGHSLPQKDLRTVEQDPALLISGLGREKGGEGLRLSCYLCPCYRIGFAIARRLAEDGAHVVVSSRKQQNVDRAVATLQGEGLSVVGTVCHVGKAEDRKRLVATVRGCRGRRTHGGEHTETFPPCWALGRTGMGSQRP